MEYTDVLKNNFIIPWQSLCLCQLVSRMKMNQPPGHNTALVDLLYLVLLEFKGIVTKKYEYE